MPGFNNVLYKDREESMEIFLREAQLCNFNQNLDVESFYAPNCKPKKYNTLIEYILTTWGLECVSTVPKSLWNHCIYVAFHPEEFDLNDPINVNLHYDLVKKADKYLYSSELQKSNTSQYTNDESKTEMYQLLKEYPFNINKYLNIINNILYNTYLTPKDYFFNLGTAIKSLANARFYFNLYIELQLIVFKDIKYLYQLKLYSQQMNYYLYKYCIAIPRKMCFKL